MRAVIITGLLAGCAATPPVDEEPVAPVQVTPPPEVVVDLVADHPPETLAGGSPVGRGEIPWWHDLDPRIYALDGEVVVLAVGRSSEHHHVAEGFLKSKVAARLGVRKASESIGFAGAMPEPELFDLFITREQRFFALYRMAVPEGAEVAVPPEPLEAPANIDVPGLHRLGRHVFDGERHLFLECDVEGPIANPDWGRSRASARF